MRISHSSLRTHFQNDIIDNGKVIEALISSAWISISLRAVIFCPLIHRFTERETPEVPALQGIGIG